MDDIYKVLAAITVWILFVFGCLSLLSGFVRVFTTSPTVPMMTAYFGFGILSLFLSVVSAKLRDMLD